METMTYSGLQPRQKTRFISIVRAKAREAYPEVAILDKRSHHMVDRLDLLVPRGLIRVSLGLRKPAFAMISTV
jgi:hypothetical protein